MQSAANRYHSIQDSSSSEAKDLGIPLTDVAKTDQLKRYRKHLLNLVQTDYLVFW